MAGRPKGQQKTGGRQKGTPNKLGIPLKQMILEALSDAGGKDYLLRQAEANPSSFMILLGKVLPTTLASDPSDPLVIEIIRFADAVSRETPEVNK